jgi:hypothetical protein
MKLLRYGNAGEEKAGVLDSDGNIRDLSGIVTDIDGAVCSPSRSTNFGQSILPPCRWCPALHASGLVSARRKVHLHRP